MLCETTEDVMGEGDTLFVPPPPEGGGMLLTLTLTVPVEGAAPCCDDDVM